MSLSLDDFENVDLESIEPKRDIIRDEHEVAHMVGVHQLLNGTFDEEQANALLNDLREYHHECYLNLGFHKNLHEDIDYGTVFYICRIIVAGERDGTSNLPDEKLCIKDFDKSSYRYWMWTLAQQMPVWIVKPEKMPMRKNNGKYPPEWFGYYNSNGPEIYLCPQRIKKAIEPLQKNGIHIDEKLLTAYVIIHMLAHAIMDVSNRLHEDGVLYKLENKCQLIEDEADMLMEESLANMVTLWYFVSFWKEAIAPNAKVAFDTIKEYISIQPMPYKFGLMQFNLLQSDWRMWRDHKRSLKIYHELK